MIQSEPPGLAARDCVPKFALRAEDSLAGIVILVGFHRHPIDNVSPYGQGKRGDKLDSQESQASL